MPFVAEGFAHGDRAFHIIDPRLRRDYETVLRDAGVDVEAAEASGQLEIRQWADAHLRDDRFNQDAMLALIQEVLTDGRTRGYPRTRFIAHMEWSLEDFPGVESIIEYEARLNEVLPQYHDPVICTYDLAKFGGGIVVDILRTHPLAIIGGLLIENPFYLPPDQFLVELRARRGVPG
jgi:hypothetical protein